MTISTTGNRVSYAGNGATTAFSFPYFFFSNSDLVVLLTKVDGTVVPKVITTDYVVTGATNPAGGTVTMLVAPATGETLVVYRDPQVTQTTDWVDNDPLPAASIENAVDKLTTICQRIKDMASRAFRLSDADASGASTTLPTPSANNLIAWNQSANGLQNIDPATLATVVASGNALQNVFSGDGTTVKFTLDYNPGSIANTYVFIGGVQQNTDQYTLSGQDVTFSVAPPAGSNNIRVRSPGALSIGIPGDGAVATIKIADDAVTTAKIVDGAITDAKLSSTSSVLDAIVDKLKFLAAGVGAVYRSLRDKLRERVSVKDYGAVGDGVTNDTAAITAAMNYLKTVNGGRLYFPKGRYVIDTGFTVNSTTFGGSFPYEASLVWEGDGPTSSVIIWTNGGFGKTGTLLDWGSGVYGGVRGIQFITNANNGHTSQSIDGFTTSSTGLAGCDSTSSVAIKHTYNGSFVIENCDFQRWHRAVWMDLGYNRAIKNCSFMYNNVGIGTYGAATINEYTNCRIERNAIGLSFALASAMKIDNVVSEANYAGCDVFITGPVHSLKFRRCYFEASPQQVVILGAGSSEIGLNAPSGLFFDECNSISIAVTSGSIGDLYLTRSIVGATPITSAGGGKFIVKDNWQHTGAGAAMIRRRASGYAISGAGKLLIKDRSEDDAWVTFSATGGTVTVLDGFNMQVTRTATGRYTFTFTYPMDHANYALVANVAGDAADVGSACFTSAGGVTSSTTQCSIAVWTYSGVAIDPHRISVRVSGGQALTPY